MLEERLLRRPRKTALRRVYSERYVYIVEILLEKTRDSYRKTSRHEEKHCV